MPFLSGNSVNVLVSVNVTKQPSLVESATTALISTESTAERAIEKTTTAEKWNLLSGLRSLTPAGIAGTISGLLMSDSLMTPLLDAGYLPHSLIRICIRRQLAERARSLATTTLAEDYESKMRYVERLKTGPIGTETRTAKRQRNELGSGVWKDMLGPRMKQSCCLYGKGGETLAQAEVAMLRLYVERAELEDGQAILDLGCGWGSGVLYFAEMFPNSTLTAFCDLRTQKEYIDNVAESKGFTNLTVIAGDVVEYEFEPSSYDRVVAVELFEHMKNYQLLLSKIARALRPGGKLFVHMFAHRSTPYDLEPGWLTDHFLANGTMLSADLLLYFQDDLQVKRQWWVNGMHYAKTCEDWLTKMWGKKKEIENGLRETYGEERVNTQWNWWQTFCIAYAELFAYEGGEAWGVGHYLFEKKVETDGEVVKTGT